MNKHYRKALIEATVEFLQENCGEENINRELLNTILDREEWNEDDPDSSFEGDIECLANTYLDTDLEETAPSPEERIEETLNSFHVGMNFVPGLGVGYCSSEEDLEAMKNWFRDRMLAAALLAKIFEEDAE